MEAPAFFFGFTVGVVMCIFIDAAVDNQPAYKYQKSAIEAGVGRYDEKTAKFEWIKPEKAEQ